MSAFSYQVVILAVKFEVDNKNIYLIKKHNDSLNANINWFLKDQVQLLDLRQISLRSVNVAVREGWNPVKEQGRV